MALILVAEDNPADVFLIREALRENGVECALHVSPDGKDVLDIITGQAAGLGELKLIILDLNLPRHDGLEILERLQETGYKHIPVVVLTTSDFVRDRQRAIELGAARFLRKPSELESFLRLGAVFKEFLGKSNAACSSA